MHHGESECDISVDDATVTLIASMSKKCPGEGCGVDTQHDGGCMHMTCTRCRTQFCFVCNQEYEKDQHGMYDVDGHHSQKASDGTLVCNQFPDHG
jgi:hypothetical protein